MEALDSDLYTYPNRITQHARSMVTGTRSLPTDSPVPYFQPLKRGHVSEGVPSDIDLPEGALHEMQNIQIPPRHVSSDVFPYLPSSGIEYNPGVMEQDKLSTYTGFNDYDILFEIDCRGAIDSVPISDERVPTTSVVIPNMTSSMGLTKNVMIGARPKHAPDSEYLLPSQGGPISVRKSQLPPVSTGHILGEGAAIFTDMTETMLTTLDQ